MDLTGFRVVFLIIQLIGGTCHAGIVIERSKSEEFYNLAEAAVKIVKRCYEGRINEIGLVDTSPDGSLVVAMSTGELLPVILMNSERMSHQHKLQIFAMTASSSTELEAILMDIKNSGWWNHMAHFYILELRTNEDGCTRAVEILRAAWRMNLLEAKFICTHGTEGRMLYSFNPYTRDAPKPWEYVGTYGDENDHPWTLLVRKYRENNEICNSMNFDKNRDLGGYEIRISVIDKSYEILIDTNKTGVESLGGIVGGVARIILQKLNATAKLMIHDSNKTLGFVDKEGKAHGFIEETANGITDFMLRSVGTYTVAKLTSTYPHYRSGLAVITQSRSRKSQLSKIASLIDASSRIGVFLVCLVTPILLKFLLRQTTTTAIFNTLRMICNAAITKIPENTSPRIYLAGMFVFTITMHGIYQGKLASLLAKHVILPNIDTRLDLAESDHTIYGHDRWIMFFSESAFKGRYVGIEGYNCTEYAIRDPSAACVCYWDDSVADTAHFKLHLSKNLVQEFDITWLIRDDWPLESKFDIILQRMVDSNLYRYSVHRTFEKTLRTIESNDNRNKDRNFKTLGLGDLSFAFVILGIGLGCGMISFIIEMGIRRF